MKPLSNFDILDLAKNIRGFRGCLMKDQLITLGKPLKNECGIFNLNNSDEIGSHWVAWKVDNNLKIFFDSYGDSMPPKELVNYLGNDLYYNSIRYQDYNDPPICGYLCLEFIKDYKKFSY